jgi:hypothetical protein
MQTHRELMRRNKISFLHDEQSYLDYQVIQGKTHSVIKTEIYISKPKKIHHHSKCPSRGTGFCSTASYHQSNQYRSRQLSIGSNDNYILIFRVLCTIAIRTPSIIIMSLTNTGCWKKFLETLSMICS